METSLSPEAVEALARSLAVKLGIKDRTDADLANQMIAFESAERKRTQDDQEFKQEVRDALRSLQRNKSDIPYVAVSVAIVAAFFSVLSLVGTARATERLSNEIREIRERMVMSSGRSAP
jgi:uncharacterized membrane protein YdfJ with MMPL/SSD domain